MQSANVQTTATEPDKRRLSFWDLMLPLAGGFAAFALVMVVVFASLLGNGDAAAIEKLVTRLQSAGEGYYFNMGVMVLLYGPPLAVMFWIARRKQLAFFVPVPGHIVGWAFGGGILYAIAFETLQNFLIQQKLVSYTPSPGELMLVPHDFAQLAAGLAVASFFGPFVEEFYFRGFLLKWSRARMPLAAAAILNAVLFGIVHFYFIQHPGPVGVFVTGVIALFGALNVWWTVRTASLWPAFASHAAYNGTGMILMFLSPGTV